MNPAKRFSPLINDILDFSKIEAGRVNLEPEVFEIHSLRRKRRRVAVAEGARERPRHRDHRREDMPISYAGDAARLRQVLVNLAGNGVKFTEHGGITIKCSLAPGNQPGEDGKFRLLFEVSDTGIGIPEGAREAIFEQFVQADQSHARKYGGTGLGLAISKRIVEAMNGRLSVDTAPGKGSTFWFMVPLPARGEERALTNDRAFFSTLSALVFVRSPIVGESLVARLSGLGVRTTLATSLEGAFTALKNEQPNTLLIDSEIAGETAGGFLRRAKEIASGLTGIVLLSRRKSAASSRASSATASAPISSSRCARSRFWRAVKAAHGA